MSAEKVAMSPQQEKFTSDSSPLGTYREFVAGRGSLIYWINYEIQTLFLSGLPGILGFGMRSLCYSPLFSACGRRPAIGRGVVLRRPNSMQLGNKVLIDDYAVLDVRGDGASLKLGDYASVGRFSTIAAKGGVIQLGNAANIGSYCRLATQSRLEIGDSVLVAAYCYIGSGNHQIGDDGAPLIAREMEIKGGVKIGAHAWIGAHSTILDGVTIGEGAVIGAHSLVRDDIPGNAVAVGAPARVIKHLS